jgi:hydrogenase maturation protease
VILVIGYGNPLRRDDVIGQRIAQMMEQRLKGEDVEIQIVFQLTPELIEPVRSAERVIFIDARAGGKAGTLLQEIVTPETGTGAFTHNVNPASLLGAAQELYGMRPTGILISIVGTDFDFGGELSPLIKAVLTTLADQVEGIIRKNIDTAHEEKMHHA